MTKLFSWMAIFLTVFCLSNQALASEKAKDFESIAVEDGSTCSALVLNTAICTIVVLDAPSPMVIGPVHCLKPVADHYQVSETDLEKKIAMIASSKCTDEK